jgi:hypothetical protein
MAWLSETLRYAVAMAASLLPHRVWERLPSHVPVERGALLSGFATLFAGAAVGIRGFLHYAGIVVSLGTGAVVSRAARGDEVSVSPAFAGLSIFEFLLLTPTGWLTLYLLGSGTYRAVAAWFDDPFGDPVLTGVDALAWGRLTERKARSAARRREDLEGPEVPDRRVNGGAAGIPDCDFAIVASRRKPGWERGVVVFTADGCYRVGDPVETTINGRLRTIYPLTEHRDLEAVRKSVRYDLPRRANES